jgi:hypothetical protein
LIAYNVHNSNLFFQWLVTLGVKAYAMPTLVDIP